MSLLVSRINAFLLFSSIPLNGCTTICLSRCWELWAIPSSGLLQIKLLQTLCAYVFLSLRKTPRNRMTSSYGSCMVCFFRNCQTGFQSHWTILHSHQQCLKVPADLHSYQHSIWLIILISVIPGSGECYLIVILTGISIITMMLSIFSRAYLSTYVFLCEVSMQIFCQFFFFCPFKKFSWLCSYSILKVLYILCIQAFCHIYDLQIFSPRVWFVLSLNSLFWRVEISNFNEVLLTNFFMDYVSMSYLRKSLPSLSSQNFLLCFPLHVLQF